MHYMASILACLSYSACHADFKSLKGSIYIPIIVKLNLEIEILYSACRCMLD